MTVISNHTVGIWIYTVDKCKIKWKETLNNSLLMRPLRKSLTNWQFSALSWDSLVPSASSSDRSVGLGGAEQDRQGDANDHLAID